MTITFISPTPGTAVGVAGGFSAALSVARETPIIVEITATTRELVKFDTKGDADPSRNVVCRDGVIQGTWAQRSIKTIIGGGYRLSILPPNGWDADELNNLTLSIDTNGANIAPVANFTFVLGANRTVQFTDTSSDPDGTVVAWSWTFGDAGTSTLQSPSHAYAAGGAYSVGLQVTDNIGGVNSISKTVGVWAVDATSLKGVPSTAADWTGVMSAAGLATGNPSNLWTMQEASGNVLDKIASADLSTVGASYANAIAGWTQKAVQLSEGGAGGLTSSAVGSLASSQLMFGYVQLRSTPSALRTVMGVGSGAAHTIAQATTAPVYSADDNAGSAQVDGTSNPGTTVRPVLVLVNISAGSFKLYTDQDKITGPWVAKGAGNLLDFGAAVGTSAPVGYLFGGLFTGTPAQLTDAQVKTLLQTLGWTIPWS